jgi:hypothetical protein
MLRSFEQGRHSAFPALLVRPPVTWGLGAAVGERLQHAAIGERDRRQIGERRIPVHLRM